MNHMKKNKYTLKKRDRTGWYWLITLVSFLVLGVWVACVATEGFTTANPYGWFNAKADSNEAVQDDDQNVSATDLILTPQNTGKVHITAARAVSEVADDGISTQNDDGALPIYVLTASTNNAKLNKFIWSIEFENPESTWADSKKVEDFVNLTVDENDTSKATVSNVAAFSEPIIITVKSKYNTDVSDTCRVDYVKRVADYSQFEEYKVDEDYKATKCLYTFGKVNHSVFYYDDDVVGTVEATVTATSLTINLGTYLTEKMATQLEEDPELRYMVQSEITIQPDQIVSPFDFIKIKEPTNMSDAEQKAEIENNEYCQLAYNWIYSNANSALMYQVRLNDFHMTLNYSATYNGQTMYLGTINLGSDTRDPDQYKGRIAWYSMGDLTKYDVVTSTSVSEDEVAF